VTFFRRPAALFATLSLGAAALVGSPLPAVSSASASELGGEVRILDAPAPAAPGSFAAGSGDRAVRLSWTVPAGVTSVVVRRTVGTTPAASPTDGTPVYSGPATSHLDRSGLSNGQDYAYAAWAVDASGTVGDRAVALARPAPAPATTLTLASNVTTMSFGKRARLTLRLQAAGKAVGAEPVALQTRVRGTTDWLSAGTYLTGPDGTVAVERAPKRNVDFRAVHARTEFGLGSTTPVLRVDVVPVISAALSRAEARTSTTVTMSGALRPAHNGQRVTLQRKSGRTWVAVATRRVDRSGTFAFPLPKLGRGSWTYRVASAAHGDHPAAASPKRAFEAYTVHTYSVATRGKVVVDVERFTKQAAAIYAHDRGWAAAHRRFQRVRSGGDFTLVLAQAAKVPTFSSVCSSTYSCRVGRYVVINQDRWRFGTKDFRRKGGTLTDYRHMVLNHETGHWLGNGHAYCGGAGKLAPVMMQQSKGLAGCKPNPWPLPSELRRNS
jgi:hypothetical protein